MAATVWQVEIRGDVCATTRLCGDGVGGSGCGCESRVEGVEGVERVEGVDDGRGVEGGRGSSGCGCGAVAVRVRCGAVRRCGAAMRCGAGAGAAMRCGAATSCGGVVWRRCDAATVRCGDTPPPCCSPMRAAMRRCGSTRVRVRCSGDLSRRP